MDGNSTMVYARDVGFVAEKSVIYSRPSVRTKYSDVETLILCNAWGLSIKIIT